MDEQNWFPEPWDENARVYDRDKLTMKEPEWERTKACVNALAGIADPAGFVADVTQLLALCDKIGDGLDCEWSADLVAEIDAIMAKFERPPPPHPHPTVRVGFTKGTAMQDEKIGALTITNRKVFAIGKTATTSPHSSITETSNGAAIWTKSTTLSHAELVELQEGIDMYVTTVPDPAAEKAEAS